TCWPGAGLPATAGRGPPLGGRGSPRWSSPTLGRPGCCGGWRSGPPRGARRGGCCNRRPPGAGRLAPGGAAGGGRGGGGEVAPVLVPLLEDELAAGDAVAALRRYSLARRAGVGAVSVHRLVQAVTADQIPEGLREAWRQAAAAVVEAAIPGDPLQSAAWPV